MQLKKIVASFKASLAVVAFAVIAFAVVAFAVVAFVVIALAMPAQASSNEDSFQDPFEDPFQDPFEDPLQDSFEDPFADSELQNFERNGNGDKQTKKTDKIGSIEKIYSLPLPLPTGRKALSGKDKSSLKSIEERAKRLELEKKFPKNYTLAKTFDLPSIEESKPITERKQFQKYSKLPDPFVKFNRYQFKSARKYEKYLFRPLAKGWRKLPNIITNPIINFSKNLGGPKDFVNALLQGNPLRAIQAVFSFTLNSTIGFGGIINVAQGIGMPDSSEDFGQTLAIYGVKSGGYLFIIEPSSTRDTAGGIVDTFAIDRFLNPAQYIIPYYGQGVSIGLGMLVGIDSYGKALEQIEAIEQGAIDLYVTTRRFYAYNRALQILNIEQAKSPNPENISPENTSPENTSFENTSSEQENASANQDESATEDPFAGLELELDEKP